MQMCRGGSYGDQAAAESADKYARLDAYTTFQDTIN